MDYYKLLLPIIAGAPVGITIAIAMFVIALVLWMNFRKINLTEITGIGALQTQQINSLQTLVTNLSAELRLTRMELNNLSKQNTEMRMRIFKLERLLTQHDITYCLVDGGDDNNHLSNDNSQQ